MVDLKSATNQYNRIRVYTIFTQQDTNSTQVPTDYKAGDTGTGFYIPRDIKQGAKCSWSKDTENHAESVITWNYARNDYQKIFENNTKIFKCNVIFTKTDLWASHWKLEVQTKFVQTKVQTKYKQS